MNWHNYPKEEPPFDIRIWLKIGNTIRKAILTTKTTPKRFQWAFLDKPPYPGDRK
jgi:hypothetical protein